MGDGSADVDASFTLRTTGEFDSHIAYQLSRYGPSDGPHQNTTKLRVKPTDELGLGMFYEFVV